MLVPGTPFLRAYLTHRGVPPERQQELLTSNGGGVIANLRSYVRELAGKHFRITIELPGYEAEPGERIPITEINVAT